MNTLEIRMGCWNGVDSAIADILSHYLREISKRMPHLSTLKLDLNGWNHPPAKISSESIDGLLRCVEDFESLMEIHIDFRNWNNVENIKKFK